MPERPLVLLVDDEPYNLDYLAQELEDRGVEIATAADGRQALAAIGRRAPDMIFLDIAMPVMDGFAVLERLQAEPAWRDIPVVIVSAFADLASMARGIELGAEDYLPKPFNPALLHARLSAGLEKKRLRDLEARHRHALERELEIGRRIQQDFLPPHLPQPPGWLAGAFFQPAREVAGDFYDAFELEEGRLALLIGDVTDKGVGAAIYMALYRSLLRAALQAGVLAGFGEPAADLPIAQRLIRAVTLVNNYICLVHDDPLFTSLFAAVLDTASGELVYVNAGHDEPYLAAASGAIRRLAATGPLVGAFCSPEFRAARAVLAPGDRLVLYTDGIPDAQAPSGEMLGCERWQALVGQSIPAGSDLLAHLVAGIRTFTAGSTPPDDITLLVVQRRHRPATSL